MRAKIQIRGIDIELEGTSEEIAAVVRAAVNAPIGNGYPWVVPQVPEYTYKLIYTQHVCKYPPTWNGIFPPPCEECGVAAPVQTIICGDTVIAGSIV